MDLTLNREGSPFILYRGALTPFIVHEWIANRECVIAILMLFAGCGDFAEKPEGGSRKPLKKFGHGGKVYAGILAQGTRNRREGRGELGLDGSA